MDRDSSEARVSIHGHSEPGTIQAGCGTLARGQPGSPMEEALVFAGRSLGASNHSDRRVSGKNSLAAVAGAGRVFAGRSADRLSRIRGKPEPITRWQPSGVFVERTNRGQFRHLREASRTRAAAAIDKEPRPGREPRLVAGWTPHRVPAI